MRHLSSDLQNLGLLRLHQRLHHRPGGVRGRFPANGAWLAPQICSLKVPSGTRSRWSVLELPSRSQYWNASAIPVFSAVSIGGFGLSRIDELVGETTSESGLRHRRLSGKKYDWEAIMVAIQDAYREAKGLTFEEGSSED